MKVSICKQRTSFSFERNERNMPNQSKKRSYSRESCARKHTNGDVIKSSIWSGLAWRSGVTGNTHYSTTRSGKSNNLLTTQKKQAQKRGTRKSSRNMNAMGTCRWTNDGRRTNGNNFLVITGAVLDTELDHARQCATSLVMQSNVFEKAAEE